MRIKQNLWQQFYSFEIFLYFLLVYIGSFTKMFWLELFGLSLITVRFLSYLLFHKKVINAIEFLSMFLLVTFEIIDHFLNFNIYFNSIFIIFLFFFAIWFFLRDKIVNRFNLNKGLVDIFNKKR